MYLRNLKILMLKKGLSQSQLARELGLSRQAISLWFASDKDFINVHTRHIESICVAFNVSPQDLLTPFPETKGAKDESALFLWDLIYKNLDDFYVALANKEWNAVGRLVQVLGLYRSSKILGKIVWDDFYKYSKFIHPSKRKVCEVVWLQKKNLA